ncbi:MAG: hypothetical protein ACI8UD_003148 [Planctomycetota bacterium]|jgi:hypothetical protein
MRAFTMLMVAVTAVACAAPPKLARAPLVPLLPVDAPAVDAGREAADAGRADRDQSAASVRGVERRFDVETSAPTYRTLIETVEVEVPVAVQGQAEPSVVYVNSGRGYSTYDDYLYNRRSYRDRQRGSRFPINTVVGAGVGAIIGHQRGRRDRGALIGGGVGLLFDLNRWRY